MRGRYLLLLLASCAPPATPAQPAPTSVAVPVPTLLSSSPITVTGYPTPLTTCLPDPAEHAGFTSDGAELGYCMQGMNLRCELVDRAGHKRSLTSTKDSESPASDPAKERAIRTFIHDSGLPQLARNDCTLRPPPLSGTWAYPDIVVSVARIASSFDKEKLVSQPLVRIGGSVAGAPPVYPLSYSAPHRLMTPATLGEIRYHVAELNALVLSPDGTELGIVVHAYCMEWCDDFQVVRMPAARFASLVYDDTGYRALQQGKLDRAIELFSRAADVDASRELPAYNLACAYARKGDRKAEAALDRAIERGGDAVRARAANDKDFDAVRSEPWFVKLTSR